MTKQKADNCYNSWKAHARNGNTVRLLQRMDKYYKSLWMEGEIKDENYQQSNVCRRTQTEG